MKRVISLFVRQLRYSVVLSALLMPVLHAEIHKATPSNYLYLLRALQPGDELNLAPGEYRHGLPLHRVNGAAGQRIVISGPDGSHSVVFSARRGTHTISILDSSYITVRNLVLDGRGLDVDGVRAEGHATWAHHITLENLRIINHHYSQQTVGISTKCSAWDWIIRNNVIVGAGTGMYLGHSNGSAPFVRGLIENNVIVDAIGYNLQIKHQHERPRLDGMPERESLTIIRHNVFAKSANSSTGKMARPNLLVGHWPPSGPGKEDTYAIYGNLFYQNPSEALFQGEGNLAFYSNILINTSGDAINIRPHNDVPRRIDLFRNTVIASKTGIRITGGDPSYGQRVTANAVFADDPIAGVEQSDSVLGKLTEAAEFLLDPFAAVGHLNVSPRSGKLIVQNLASLKAFPDAHLDFDGRMYVRPMAGAYSDSGVRPLSLAPKRMTANSEHGPKGPLLPLMPLRSERTGWPTKFPARHPSH
jgi:hypothetical protein